MHPCGGAIMQNPPPAFNQGARSRTNCPLLAALDAANTFKQESRSFPHVIDHRW